MIFDFDWPSGFWEDFWKCWQPRNLRDLRPMSKNNLDLRHMLIFCINLVYNEHHRYITDCNSFDCLGVFLYTSTRNEIWLLHKKVKGQPVVIIWTNWTVLECSMLHTKCQWSRSSSLKKNWFFNVLLYMGMAAILVMWPWLFEQTFLPQSIHTTFGFN